jgi:hypothetical protein
LGDAAWVSEHCNQVAPLLTLELDVKRPFFR